MTTVGPVSLTVSDLPRALALYTERLGFRVHAEAPGAARLGAGGDDVLVLVERQRGAARAAGMPVSGAVSSAIRRATPSGSRPDEHG